MDLVTSTNAREAEKREAAKVAKIEEEKRLLTELEIFLNKKFENNYEFSNIAKSHITMSYYYLNSAGVTVNGLATYDNLNTQKYLHPSLSVPDGDILSARKLANQLRDDVDFYKHCSEETKNKYKKHYKEDVFLKKVNKIIGEISND